MHMQAVLAVHCKGRTAWRQGHKGQNTAQLPTAAVCSQQRGTKAGSSHEFSSTATGSVTKKKPVHCQCQGTSTQRSQAPLAPACTAAYDRWNHRDKSAGLNHLMAPDPPWQGQLWRQSSNYDSVQLVVLWGDAAPQLTPEGRRSSSSSSDLRCKGRCQNLPRCTLLSSRLGSKPPPSHQSLAAAVGSSRWCRPR